MLLPPVRSIEMTKKETTKKDMTNKYLQDCFETLKEFNVIKTKRQFSKVILGKGKGLTGVIICEERPLSNYVLGRLAEYMSETAKNIRNTRFQELATQGADLIMERVDEYLWNKSGRHFSPVKE
jgi:hypothetical protein